MKNKRQLGQLSNVALLSQAILSARLSGSFKAECKKHQPVWEFRPCTAQSPSTLRDWRGKGKVWVRLKSLSPFLIQV